jgi:hypothetical protein
VATGAVLQTLEGHCSPINVVAVLAERQAGGVGIDCWDRQAVDAATGAALQTLEAPFELGKRRGNLAGRHAGGRHRTTRQSSCGARRGRVNALWTKNTTELKEHINKAIYRKQQ